MRARRASAMLSGTTAIFASCPREFKNLVTFAGADATEVKCDNGASYYRMAL